MKGHLSIRVKSRRSEVVCLRKAFDKARTQRGGIAQDTFNLMMLDEEMSR